MQLMNKSLLSKVLRTPSSSVPALRTDIDFPRDLLSWRLYFF
jgi:hypothetical protein